MSSSSQIHNNQTPTQNADLVNAELRRREQLASWPLYYPRIYQPSPDYASAKLPAHWLAANMKVPTVRVRNEARSRTISNDDFAPMLEKLLAMTLVGRMVPTVWIDRDLSLQLAHERTKASEWFCGQLAMEAAVLMIPRGTLLHPEGGDVDWILYNKSPTMMTVVAATRFRSNTYCFPVNVKGEYGPETKLWPPSSSLTNPVLTIGLWNYFRNTIAAMISNPRLITHGECTARVDSQWEGHVTEFWTPTTLGASLPQTSVD